MIVINKCKSLHNRTGKIWHKENASMDEFTQNDVHVIGMEV